MILLPKSNPNAIKITQGITTTALIIQIMIVRSIIPNKVMREPKRVMSFGTRRSPIIAATDPPVYNNPRDVSGINWFKNDELLYRMSAVCTENKNPIK
jgi:hypothetical protein